jgi:hypothetical protein
MPTTKVKTSKAEAAKAAKKITARPSPRAVAPRAKEPALGDHPDTLGIIHRAMNSGAQKAVAENDSLGIATPGAKDGNIVWRQPAKKRTGRTPEQG